MCVCKLVSDFGMCGAQALAALFGCSMWYEIPTCANIKFTGRVHRNTSHFSSATLSLISLCCYFILFVIVFLNFVSFKWMHSTHTHTTVHIFSANLFDIFTIGIKLNEGISWSWCGCDAKAYDWNIQMNKSQLWCWLSIYIWAVIICLACAAQTT